MSYLEEKMPIIKKERINFIEDAKTILEREAGKELDMSEYIRTDGYEEN